jgi:hypothetical protein
MARGSGCGIAAAEIEVGRVEGAGIQAFLTTGMDSLDQTVRELLGAHPYVR